MNDLYAMDKSDLLTLGKNGKKWLLENQLISVQVNRILDKLAALH